MKEVLALKFAAWLHPPFEVWVYKTIRAILRGEQEAGTTQKERAIMRQEAVLKAEATQLQRQLADHPIQQKLNEVEAQRKHLQRTRAKLVKGQMDLFFSEAIGALPDAESERHTADLTGM